VNHRFRAPPRSHSGSVLLQEVCLDQL